LNFVTDIGSVDSLACILDPPLLAYSVGLVLRVRVAATNSGSATIDAGPGRVLIKRTNGLSTSPGDLPAGGVVSLVYDGTGFQIVNSQGFGGGGGGGPPPTVSAIPYVVDTSTLPNIINAPFSPPITALSAGTAILVKIANTNTGPTVINVNAINNVPVRANGHGALLPNDIAAGDIKFLVYDGAVFWLESNALSASVGHGRCYLSLSGSNLLLTPRNGNGLIVGGVLVPIPSAGISLAPGGSPGVNNIYAFLQANALTLEAAPTVPVLNSDGVMVKTGDATRSLVGKAYLNTYGQWQDQDGFIGVLSWFNRRAKRSMVIDNGPSAYNMGASGAWIEISSTYRNYFLTWADETNEAQLYGTLGGIGSSSGLLAVSVDGAATPDYPWYMVDTPVYGVGGNYAASLGLTAPKVGLSDSVMHYCTAMCRTIAGTIQLYNAAYPYSGSALIMIARG
jgi:hypothetical protein